MLANVNRDTGHLASAGASAPMDCQVACISHRIGPRSGFTPFRYYYTAKLLKVACDAVWSSSERTGKMIQGT